MLSINYKNKLKERKFFLLFITYLSISIIFLICAYFIEYILGHKPCPLCIYQRIPYFAIIIASLISIILKKTYRIGIIVLLLSQFTSILISGYHSGIERKIFTPLDGCTKSDFDSKITIDNYLALINKKEAVSCADISFKILGLSMANYNFIINLFMLYFFIRIILYRTKINKNAETSVQK